MTDALLVVDVVNTFHHDDGEALLTSFRARLAAMVAVLRNARNDGRPPIVYINDAVGDWRGRVGGVHVVSSLDQAWLGARA